MFEPDRRDQELLRAYAQIERTHELARQVRSRWTPALPNELGAFRIRVHHRPRARSAGSFWGWAPRPGDALSVWLCTPGGSATEGILIGALLQCRLHAFHHSHWNGGDPAVALGQLQELLGNLADPAPLVGIALAAVDASCRTVTLARAGLPAPVLLPHLAPPRFAGDGGPYLGAFTTQPRSSSIVMNSGDRLILRSGLPTTGEDHLPTILEQHRQRSGTSLLQAIVHDLALDRPEQDELTLIVIEWTGPASTDLP